MKRLISFSLFLIVAGLTWWSTIDFFDNQDDIRPLQGKHFIKIFMNEFEMITMDKNGMPAYILNGEHFEQYNDSDDATVKQPVVFLLDSDTRWKISSRLARINNTKNTVLLIDDVLMQQQDIEPAITIRTQRLLIHTESQIAQTKAAVEITQGNSQVTSIGMIYNNISRELELSSQVSGYYSAYE
jgi:LPS export ABC transporter protein LptC